MLIPSRRWRLACSIAFNGVVPLVDTSFSHSNPVSSVTGLSDRTM
jgi:hypothetical protein